ncbi:hypothetical protein BV22DRAFT_1163312 [Leucogyrophana mollusca]|uniref:Uncharacterized protein n=1 Tax=Leucogyrophana mollusca TaxID=85980 RepID=A0ACB8BHM8_9AGAM|nr:hypothetical protein BV22DRAFT_1163312 [Leucogyrophana mollusca]
MSLELSHQSSPGLHAALHPETPRSMVDTLLKQLGPTDDLHPFLLSSNHPKRGRRPPCIHFGFGIDNEKLRRYAEEQGYNEEAYRYFSEIPDAMGYELEAFGLAKVDEVAGKELLVVPVYGKMNVFEAFSFYTNYVKPEDRPQIPQHIYDICKSLSYFEMPRWFVEYGWPQWDMKFGGPSRTGLVA